MIMVKKIMMMMIMMMLISITDIIFLQIKEYSINLTFLLTENLFWLTVRTMYISFMCKI